MKTKRLTLFNIQIFQHYRGARKRADYILYYKPDIPIAIIEAKDNKHFVGSGMQQALDYANILDIPFVLYTLLFALGSKYIK